MRVPNINDHERRIAALEGGLRLVGGLVIILGIITFLTCVGFYIVTAGHGHG